MRLNNKGLSVVELVVVISIMSIMTGLIAVGLGSVFSKPADECAEKLYNSLNTTRIATMGKNTDVLRLYENGGYVRIEETITDKAGNTTTKDNRIGEKNVQVEYRLSTGGWIPLDGTGVTFKFKRTTGGFEEVLPGQYVEEIRVSKGSKLRTLKLYSLTGKVTIQ